MKRNTALKVLNPIVGVLALCQILSGLLSDFFAHDTFMIVHKTGGIAFAAAAILHVTLNGNWIKVNYFRGNPAVGG
jgi:hypothetical protein